MNNVPSINHLLYLIQNFILLLPNSTTIFRSWSRKMNNQGPSRLELLPAEISDKILEELVALHKTDGTILETRKKRWLQRYVFHPDIEPQVLRVNRTMHAQAKNVLDRSNRWIVLDMDSAYTLTSWTSSFLEMIIIDPESAQDIPPGMMHVRIKPFTKASDRKSVV